MTINPLSSNIINLLSEEPSTRAASPGSGVANFADILTQSFETAGETDKFDKQSALELLSGQTDDMSGLLIDATKADLALQLSLQIKNKVVDAYNEIMRVQV